MHITVIPLHSAMPFTYLITPAVCYTQVDYASMRCQEAFHEEVKAKEEGDTEGQIAEGQEPRLPAKMCGVKLSDLPTRLPGM